MSDKIAPLSEKKREALRLAGIFPYSPESQRLILLGILLLLAPRAGSLFVQHVQSLFAVSEHVGFSAVEELLASFPMYLIPALGIAIAISLLLGALGGRGHFRVQRLLPGFSRLSSSGRRSERPEEQAPWWEHLCGTGLTLLVTVFFACFGVYSVLHMMWGYWYSLDEQKLASAAIASATLFHITGSLLLVAGLFHAAWQFVQFRQRHQMTKAELEAEIREASE